MVRIQEPKMEKEDNAYAQSSRYGNHPFSNSIISAPLPKGVVFDLPRMEQYDGSSDPQDHLSMFNIRMLFYGATDPIMCRAFPCTLSKHPLRWFFTLPPNSINNFSDLSTKFLAHFSSSERSNDEKTTTSRKRFCSCRETNSNFDDVDLAPITFSFDDDSYYYQPGIKYLQSRDGPLPMVISTKINNIVVYKVLIDQGSSADILYFSQLFILGLTRSMMKPYEGNTIVVGGTGKRVEVSGYVDLDTTFGEGGGEQRRTIKVRYLVVEDSSWSPSAYNVVIGRPALNELGAIVSTPHMTMKFPARNGKVGVVKADINMARKCHYDTHTDISRFALNDFPTKW